MSQRAIAALFAFAIVAACGGGGGEGGGGGLPGVPSGPVIVHSEAPGQVFGLVGAAANTIAYQTALDSTATHIRNVVTGADVALPNSKFGDNLFALTPEWIYGRWVTRPAANCTSNCLLRWPIAGGPATPVPYSGGDAFEIKAKGRFAAWREFQGATIWISDAPTGAVSEIVIRTAGIQVLGFDLAVVNGAAVVYYWTGPFNGSLTRDVLLSRWTEAGGSVAVEEFTGTNAPPSGAQPIFNPLVAADGDLVAYTAWNPAVGGAPASVSTVMRLGAGGVRTTLGGAAPPFPALRLKDGVIVWVENLSGSGASTIADVKAWTQPFGVTALETAAPYPTFLGASSGFAVYSTGPTPQDLYSWNGATGAKLKRSDQPGFRTFLTDNWIYFIAVAEIFRVSMN